MRKYAETQRIRTNSGPLTVLCNPGLIPGDPVKPIFNQCSVGGDNTAIGLNTDPVTGNLLNVNYPIANRVLIPSGMSNNVESNAYCVRTAMPPVADRSRLEVCDGTILPNGAGCSTVTGTTSAKPGFADEGIPAGSDIWEPVPQSAAAASPLCTSGDPLKICTRTPNSVLFNGSDANYTNNKLGVPRDLTVNGQGGNPVIKSDLDSVERSDYLYIVTPETVGANDINALQQYTPYRIRRAGSCPYSDLSGMQNDPNCGNSNRIFYNIYANDLSDPANKPAQFPLCVLQPEASD